MECWEYLRAPKVCQRCCGHRVASVSAKCSDRVSFSLGDNDRHGGVPNDAGIGEGDYLEIDYCLDCGQLQGSFPLNEIEV